jgi:hypothetical protein
VTSPLALAIDSEVPARTNLLRISRPPIDPGSSNRSLTPAATATAIAPEGPPASRGSYFPLPHRYPPRPRKEPTSSPRLPGGKNRGVSFEVLDAIEPLG